MNNENLQAEETEFLTADEQKLCELIGSLKKVSAPNDFEFRLKARIAARKDDNYQTGSREWLRYLLPVGASAFVLAFVLYATNFFAPPPVEKAAETNPPQSEKAVTNPVETPANTIVAAANSNKAEDLPVNPAGQNGTSRNSIEEKPILISDAKNLNKQGLPKKSREEEGGGSRLSSLSKAPVTLPVNLNPDQELTKPQDLEKPQPITAAEVWNIIGIETVSEGGKLKVKSVKQNSPAGLSGIKDGDFIDAIDDQKIELNNKTQNLKAAKKITVLRDGKIITYELKLD